MPARTAECINEKGKHRGWMILCPACQEGHFLNLGYEFNEDFNSPTFSPSIDIAGGDLNHRCHAEVREGFIIYEKDCTHPFAGKTLELPAIEE